MDIMESLKKLEINKLIKELDWVESDFQLKNEIVYYKNDHFINDVNNLLTSYPDLKDIYDSKISNSSLLFEKNNDDLIENSNKEVKDKLIKSLYYNISKLTHPDKIDNALLNKLYLNATNYYNDNNLLGIIKICELLDLDYDLSSINIDDLMRDIGLLRSKVNHIESSLTWKWINEKDKDKVLLEYIKGVIL